jgi:hypothetical protein
VELGVHTKSDSTSFPGKVVDALTSVQLPLVVTLNWSTLLKHLVDVSVPETKFPSQRNTVSIAPVQAPPVWLLTKCQAPVPLHDWPDPLLNIAASA